jgi:hypothetical protein
MTRQGQPDIWALSDLCTPWCVPVVATLRIADHMAAGIAQVDDLAAAPGRRAADRNFGPTRRSANLPST